MTRHRRTPCDVDEKLELLSAEAQLDFMVCGVGRSGTTILAQLLDQDPEITVLPETQIVRRLYGRHPLRALSRRHAAVRVRTDERLRQLELPPSFEERLGRLGPVYEPADIYRMIVRHYRLATGASLVGDKAPIATEHLALLRDVFPAVRIVHIVRDPLDVIASRKEAGWSARRPLALHLWALRSQRETVEAFAREHPRSVYEVGYEDLVGDPVGSLAGLCSFLGAGNPERMVTAQASGKASPRSEPWHRNVAEPVRATQVGRGRAALEERERIRVTRYLQAHDRWFTQSPGDVQLGASGVADRSKAVAISVGERVYRRYRKARERFARATATGCHLRLLTFSCLTLEAVSPDRGPIFGLGPHVLARSPQGGADVLTVRGPFGWVARLELGARLARAGIHGAQWLPDGGVVVVTRGHIWSRPPDGSWSRAPLAHGKRPLRQGWFVDGDCVVYGEYVSNADRTATVAVRSVPLHGAGPERVVYAFPPGEVRHIHSVSSFDGGLLVLTGDRDSESRFTQVTRSGEARVVGSGSQTWRACSAVQLGNTLMWGMDAPDDPPALLRMRADDGTPEQVAVLDGPIYYSDHDDHASYFGRTVEHGSIERDALMTLWRAEGADLRRAVVTSKDGLPNRWFGHGVLWFPRRDATGSVEFVNAVGSTSRSHIVPIRSLSFS